MERTAAAPEEPVLVLLDTPDKFAKRDFRAAQPHGTPTAAPAAAATAAPAAAGAPAATA